MCNKLGKEWKNTSIIEFSGAANPKKLVTKLFYLDFLTEPEAAKFYTIKNLSDDPGYKKLIKRMNKIAPKGCSFKTVTVNGYTKSGFFG